MAKMFPVELPSWIKADPRRTAERSVFKSLSQSLDDEFFVYYSRPWWGLDSKGAEIDGECDFIIAHRALGILFVEVKGGRIEHDPETSQWYTTDRNNVKMRIKDPCEQAMKSKHHILKKLQGNESWPRGKVIAKHGVIFPDSRRPESRLQNLSGYEQVLFAFSEDVHEGIENWVKNRFLLNVGNSEVGLGEGGLSALVEVVASPVRLASSLSVEISNQMEYMDKLLTGAQLELLLDVQEMQRCVIYGGAGCGKTVMATELAARAADGGKSVLLLCTNYAQKVKLEACLRNSVTVIVLTFSEFVVDWTKLSSSEFDFDLILVDEGQDVDFSWWSRIESLANGQGRLVVFYDSNQAVYRNVSDVASILNAEEKILRLNLRNSKQIAYEMDQYYEGPLVRVGGPDSFPVMKVDCDPSSIFLQVSAVIRDFIAQGISTHQIVVLCSDENELSLMNSKLREERIFTTRCDDLRTSGVTLETVARYKGLESPVVIVAMTWNLKMSKEFAYVAVSRARTRLVLIGAV